MSVPDFSVIIPSFNRPQTLARCLDALAQLDPTGPAFEVLVVDDGGETNLDEVVDPVRGRIVVSLLRQAHAGPGAARNTGLKAARGRWVAFTDDDCLPDARWLSGFARGFARFPRHALGGRTTNLVENNVYAAAHQLLVDYITRAFRDNAAPRFFPSNNQAFEIDPLRSVGGFDTTFPFAAGEDRDLCDRWLAAGHRLADAPEAIVRHGHALALDHFCRMHHRYGRGARRFRRKIAARRGGPVRLEPIGFYMGLMLAPLAAAPARQAPALCAVLAVSQLCHAAGYVREAWLERRDSGVNVNDRNEPPAAHVSTTGSRRNLA